jgi:hypothetical protein
MYPLFLKDFDETWILSTDLNNTQISNFIKVCSVGTEFFFMDRRKEKHDEANSPFRNFLKASKYTSYKNVLKNKEKK